MLKKSQKYILISLSVLLLLAVSVFAKKAQVSDQVSGQVSGQPSVTQSAEKILKQYNKKTGIELNIEVKTEKKTLGTVTNQKANLKSIGKKVFLAVEGEKKSEVIFNGEKLYVISYPDLDLDPDGKRKVIITKITDDNHMSVLSQLFSQPQTMFKKFKIEKIAKPTGEFELKLISVKNDIRPLYLQFNKKILSSIFYTDDVGTETTLILSEPKAGKFKSKIFNYIQKKTDEVITQ